MLSRYKVLPLALITLFLSAPLAGADDENPLTPEFKAAQQKSFVDGARDFFGSQNSPSQWADIKSWKLIGNRFAAAYNSQQELIAIYDLSYPTLGGHIALGEVGSPEAGSNIMSQVFNDSVDNMGLSDLSPSVQSATLALGATPNTVFSTDVFPKNWWTSISWASRSQLAQAPGRFKITDLDLEKMNIGSGMVSGLRSLYGIVLGDADAVASLSDARILGAFEFVQASDGGYLLTWSDPREASNKTPLPRKLLDFVSPHDGLYENLEIQETLSGLSKAASAIPVPVVEAMLATAISRVGRYYAMTEAEHLEMLHEVVAESNEGSINEPVIASLGGADASILINAFELTRVSPEDAWKWFSQIPPQSGIAKLPPILNVNHSPNNGLAAAGTPYRT